MSKKRRGVGLVRGVGNIGGIDSKFLWAILGFVDQTIRPGGEGTGKRGFKVARTRLRCGFIQVTRWEPTGKGTGGRTQKANLGGGECRMGLSPTLHSWGKLVRGEIRRGAQESVSVTIRESSDSLNS